MSEVVSVFVASPTDVPNERLAVFEVLTRLPNLPAYRKRLHFNTMAWEGPFTSVPVPMLASMDPEQSILEGLDRPRDCDIVVVILHGRIGTDLPEKYNKEGGHRPVSGTEWEYEDAIDGADQSGKPDVIVYRKLSPVEISIPAVGVDRESTSEVLRQKERVEAFFARLKSEGRAFNAFDTSEEFAKAFSLHLEERVVKILTKREQEAKANESIDQDLVEWLKNDGPEPEMSRLIQLARDPLLSPHFRIAAAQAIESASADSLKAHRQAIRQLTEVLFAHRDASLGMAGVRIARALLDAGAAELDVFDGAFRSRPWAVRDLAVSNTRHFDDPYVIGLYEANGSRLSYWRPVQSITEQLERLAPNLDASQLQRAIGVLEALLSNPRQSEKQQENLQSAITRLRSKLDAPAE